MSYIKNSLPDDWELDQSFINKKYTCIGNDIIEAAWLPRWYGVSHDDCYFYPHKFPVDLLDKSQTNFPNSIVLLPLPEGSDYKQKLKELKTERLLNGI